MPTTQTIPGLELLSVLPARGTWVESVAVVGNAPTVLAGEQGAMIEDHDLIIRFNDGVPDGFERQVGRRTDIRFFGARIRERHHAFFTDHPPDPLLVTYAFNVETLASLAYAGEVAAFDVDAKPPRDALERLGRLVPPTRRYHYPPRSGLVVLSLLTPLMEAGRRVSLFGFETTFRPGGEAHYYPDGLTLSTDPHEQQDHCPPDWEFTVLKRLEEAGFVAIH